MKEFIVPTEIPEEIEFYEEHKCKEIVRCKNCKHGKELFPDYISCEISDENEAGCHVSHKPDWFCADGERKEVK